MYRPVRIIVAISVFLITCAMSVLAEDILVLNNKKIFEGKVTKIRGCEIIFKVSHEKYVVPAADIFLIKFEDTNDKVYTSFLQSDYSEKCLKGEYDADMYHGKAGLHIILGVLFGPAAIIGVGASNPSPYTGARTYAMSANKDLFTDPEYLDCYREKAKGKNLGKTALGAGIMIAFTVWMLTSSGF
jgi:hypothetical protein